MSANILFLCTGNSARSVLAEAYMNMAGAPEWRAYSAGSKPTGTPNPFAIETLQAHNVPAQGGDGEIRSKSWDEFGADNAPLMDVVVTVCDNAAAETCPVWPTQSGTAPKKYHWGFADPAAATGDDDAKRAAFEEIFQQIKARLDAFLADQKQS